jgi:uncharacterized protein YcbX
MAYLSRILIYPVKSLDGISVQSIRMLKSGALEGDRQFALVDSAGKFVNGKRFPAIHRLRGTFNATARLLQISIDGDGPAHCFHVDQQRDRLEQWLTEYFHFPVALTENTAAGFPDDTDSPGPTLISTATLHEVASWFAGITPDSMRARFRANLEFGGVDAFWEDRLYKTAGNPLNFRIGDVEFLGINPCQRCVVPPRDPATGANSPDFAKTFAARRQSTLPPWAERSRFNHFYRLAVNTIVPSTEVGKTLQVGDELTILA